jgi:hypothetical protein
MEQDDCESAGLAFHATVDRNAGRPVDRGSRDDSGRYQCWGIERSPPVWLSDTAKTIVVRDADVQGCVLVFIALYHGLTRRREDAAMVRWQLRRLFPQLHGT